MVDPRTCTRTHTNIPPQGLYFNRTAVQPKYDYECANGEAWLRKSSFFCCVRCFVVPSICFI